MVLQDWARETKLKSFTLRYLIQVGHKNKTCNDVHYLPRSQTKLLTYRVSHDPLVLLQSHAHGPISEGHHLNLWPPE